MKEWLLDVAHYIEFYFLLMLTKFGVKKYKYVDDKTKGVPKGVRLIYVFKNGQPVRYVGLHDSKK